ncbi:Satratoxin biosynthesis SC20 cluster protein [Paramyrothecium foliicola]|nr:Satratoxin biosynthesis SC20 cluster protein [Paramyrothecium foliicola]
MSSCGAPVRDAQNSYIAVSNTLAVLIGICVLQRMVSKLFWKLNIALDDWIIFFTTLLFTVPSLVINVHGLVANGMGHDIWTVPFEQITLFGTFFHVMATLYFTQMALIKLTLLVFYLRIFPTIFIRRVLYGTIIFTCLYGVVYMFTAIFQCLPVTYFSTKWDGEHEGSCASINAITWSNAGISIALDFWMLAIPLSQLSSLNLDGKKKIGVAMMFCVGTLFTIVSIVRLHVLVKFGHTENPTWDYLEVCKWSTIEIAVGIICVCMPSFRLLLTRLFPSFFHSSHRSYANYASNGDTAPSSSKNRTRPLGLVTTSQKGTQLERINSSGITLSRSYAIELSDNDEDDLRFQS